MTPDQARLYVRRWHELSTLSPERALAAAGALIDAALRVPLPAARRASSGLVDQQRLFHRKRP